MYGCLHLFFDSNEVNRKFRILFYKQIEIAVQSAKSDVIDEYEKRIVIEQITIQRHIHTIKLKL